MLVIRRQQIDAITELSRAEFEQRLHAHARRCFAVTEHMSEEAIDEVIRYGMARAATYGVNTERDVCKYINLMFVFGRDFDEDPRLPWVSEILDGTRVHRVASIIELVCDTALRHEADAQGFDGETP